MILDQKAEEESVCIFENHKAYIKLIQMDNKMMPSLVSLKILEKDI